MFDYSSYRTCFETRLCSALEELVEEVLDLHAGKLRSTERGDREGDDVRSRGRINSLRRIWQENERG